MTETQKKFESIVTKRDIPLDHAYDVLRAVCFASRKFNSDWHSCVDIHDCYMQESVWTIRAFMDAALIVLDERDYSFGLEYSHKVAHWGNYINQTSDTCKEVLDILDEDAVVDDAVIAIIEFCSDFAKFDLPFNADRLHMHKHFRGKVDSRFIDYSGSARTEDEVWDYFVKLAGYALYDAIYHASESNRMYNKLNGYVELNNISFGPSEYHEWIFVDIESSRVPDSRVRKLIKSLFWRADKWRAVSDYLTDRRDYFEKLVLLRRWLLSNMDMPELFGISIEENKILRVAPVCDEDNLPVGMRNDNPKN